VVMIWKSNLNDFEMELIDDFGGKTSAAAQPSASAQPAAAKRTTSAAAPRAAQRPSTAKKVQSSAVQIAASGSPNKTAPSQYQ